MPRDALMTFTTLVTLMTLMTLMTLTNCSAMELPRAPFRASLPGASSQDARLALAAT